MKRDYLSRLARWARWYLPPAEAAEVLEDYREIAGERTEEELRRDIGNPRDAVRQLAQPRLYRRWLTVFAVLVLCLLVPMMDTVLTGASLFLYQHFQTYFLWGSSPATSGLAVILFPLGAALSFAWFRREREKCRTPLKGAVPLMGVVLLGMAWVWFLAWAMLTEQWDILDFLFPAFGMRVTETLALNVLIAGTAGIIGLVKARLGDRRWLAVYIMSLAGAGLSIFLWRMLTNMSYDPSAGWQLSYWIRLVFVTFAGLVGTAVSLC